ncbi:uncharacterized protein LOC124114805 [Haliotis rufescens]|uniref:uncharacterized protein LOC124114805 n=1 Tax=Haliotis rufescens TaxID=6454 RepID=UPI00201E969C|nr:uncharacterized protein LOC124114805 [Haliotis rufescens]
MRVLVLLLCVWCSYSQQGTEWSTSSPGETRSGKPKLVDAFSCCVDNWESMLCTWELGQNLIFNDSVTVRLKWAIMHRSGKPRDALSSCSHQTKTSCRWKSNDGRDTYKSGMIYYMEVVVATVGKANEALLETQNFTIDTNMLVRPAPVDSLTVVDRNTTCLSLQWQHSKGEDRTILYTLHVRQGSQLQIYNYTDISTVTTCGLHPGRTYTLLVSCIPIPYTYSQPHGFYSEWTSVVARTMEDVPSGVPGIEISSFRYHKCSSQTSDCEVTIYWQPVPDVECNGEITQYQVTQIDTEIGQKQEFEVEGSDTSINLGIKKVRQYLIRLKARTRVGYSEQSASMEIPAYQYKLPPPSDVLVEAEGSVLNISWGPPEHSQDSPKGHTLGYTLYYCTRSKSTFKCRDPIQLLHLPINQTSFQWEVPDGNPDNKMIGISAEMEISTQNYSSGLSWNECVYNKRPNLHPPQNVRFSRKQPHNGLRADWDTFDPADGPVCISHFVLSFCVSYSQAECAGPSVQVNVSNKDVTHVIQGLSAGVKYRVTLRAVSRSGEGPESEAIIKEVTEAPQFTWVVVLVVVLVLVLLVFVLCVCCWKVHKLTKEEFYLPVTMPKFPASQITRSNGQNNNNNSTKKTVSVSSESALLSNIEHKHEANCQPYQVPQLSSAYSESSSTSGPTSSGKANRKLHRRDQGSSSDASETLSSKGNDSVETYLMADLPSMCTNSDNQLVSMSDLDLTFSGQNNAQLYVPRQEVQLGFVFASSSASCHGPLTHSQSPFATHLPSLTCLPTGPLTQSQAPPTVATPQLSNPALPFAPPTQSQAPPTVATPYLSNPALPFAPPTQSQAPPTVAMPQLSNPALPFAPPTQSQAPPTITTPLLAYLPSATPIPSCTPVPTHSTGYVSYEEALNLGQDKILS